MLSISASLHIASGTFYVTLGFSSGVGTSSLSADGGSLAVVEPSATNIVFFRHGQFRTPHMAFSLLGATAAPLTDRFNSSIAWTPSGSFASVTTSEGQLFCFDGTIHFLEDEHPLRGYTPPCI